MELVIQQGHTSHVSGVVYSEDGRYLLSAGWDAVLLMSTEGHEADRIEVPEPDCEEWDRVVRSVQFTPDGKYLICSTDHHAKVFSFSAGSAAHRFTARIPLPGEEQPLDRGTTADAEHVH